jgi:hypothetical protein
MDSGFSQDSAPSPVFSESAASTLAYPPSPLPRGWRWGDLAGWTRAYANELGGLDAEAARQKALAVEAGNAPKAFAGAGWSKVDEPDGSYRSAGQTISSDGTVSRYSEHGQGRDDYSRREASLGIRFSLLGTREAEQRNLLDARQEAADAAVQAKKQALLNLHDAARLYDGYVRSRERQRLAVWFLGGEPAARALLDRRVAARRMLPAERSRLLSVFGQAHFAARKEALQQREALRRLGLLAGRTLPPVDAAPAGLPPQCQGRRPLPVDGHPELEAAQKEREWLDARAREHDFDGMDASLSVSHAWQHNQGGDGGEDTALGFSVQIPLEWQGEIKAARARDALRREAAGERERRTARRLGLEAELAMERWQLAQSHVGARLADLAAAKEGLRVARLRLPQFDGDGIARAMEARQRLWQAALDVFDALSEADAAAADVAWFSPGCALEEEPQDAAEAVLAELKAALDKELKP